MSINNNDLKLGHIVREIRMCMPDQRFEETLMARIELASAERRSRKYIRYAMFSLTTFLLAGLLAYFSLNLWLPALSTPSANGIKIFFELVFVCCLLIQSDRMYNYWMKYKLLAIR